MAAKGFHHFCFKSPNAAYLCRNRFLARIETLLQHIQHKKLVSYPLDRGIFYLRLRFSLLASSLVFHLAII